MCDSVNLYNDFFHLAHRKQQISIYFCWRKNDGSSKRCHASFFLVISTWKLLSFDHNFFPWTRHYSMLFFYCTKGGKSLPQFFSIISEQIAFTLIRDSLKLKQLWVTGNISVVHLRSGLQFYCLRQYIDPEYVVSFIACVHFANGNGEDINACNTSPILQKFYIKG